jgi:hypothetical protein
VADSGGHAAHLAIAAFSEGEFDPAVRHGFAVADGRIARPEVFRLGDGAGFRWAGAAIAEIDADGEGFQGGGIGDALDLRPVGFRDLVLRIGDARLQGAVIGEDQEALGIIVEPAGGVDAGDGDEFLQRALAAAFIRKLGEDVIGFVEEDESQLITP